MNRICDKVAIALPSIEEVKAKTEGVCPLVQIQKIVHDCRLASCGKGVMCRDGSFQLCTILDDIVSGKGEDKDVTLLKELCETIEICNECELSVKMAQLVLASLEAHAAEWELHIRRKACTELVCFYTLHVSAEKCTGCGKCLAVCPKRAIAGGEGMIHVVNNMRCDKCGKCLEVCESDAFVKAGLVKPRCPESPVPVGSFSSTGLRRRRRG